MALHQKQTTPFLNILGSTGDLRMVVDADTPGAKLREYETSDGKKGTKHELVYSNVDGLIKNVRFEEGDYGKNILVTLDFEDDSDGVTVAFGAASGFGEDFLKKLPALDMSKRVDLRPFSIEEGDKTKKGISIKQDGEKVKSFFYDFEKEVDVHGIPVKTAEEQKDMDKEDWIIHFTQVRKFLVKYAEEHILPQFAAANAAPAGEASAQKTEEELEAEFQGKAPAASGDAPESEAAPEVAAPAEATPSAAPAPVVPAAPAAPEAKT